MSIKADKWIRRMAAEQGMIEPFEPGQIRTNAGDRIVSYGTSSYGYDVRCADEFKIFTNINSAVVDPKAFDANSFVDYKGEVCIIPPNSFALARTIEYFRIPRNVLTICLGKSTYARCFRGDTRVALVDGSAPTLEEMARRADCGEMFWGYSIGEHGRVIVTLLDAPRYVGSDVLLEIILDDCEAIHCTPDHEFLLRDGTRAQADALRPGDSLMPLYREVVRGCESVYQPLNDHLVATHRLADEWNLRNGIYAETEGAHRHHRDHNCRNNVPWNIGRMEAGEHIRHHNPSTYDEDFGPAAHSLARRDALQRLAADPVWCARYSRPHRKRALQETGSVRGAARLLNCGRSFFRGFPQSVANARGRQSRNHKIKRIRQLPGHQDVFCLTVPEAGNFALEAGVFVRNCGIIVNVTPLEPEWEGHVTLEFSNTTPLPARIYANEGVAQMLFFESDEVCETSYKDRGGKYQGQSGVTLPRT